MTLESVAGESESPIVEGRGRSVGLWLVNEAIIECRRTDSGVSCKGAKTPIGGARPLSSTDTVRPPGPR